MTDAEIIARLERIDELVERNALATDIGRGFEQVNLRLDHVFEHLDNKKSS